MEKLSKFQEREKKMEERIARMKQTISWLSSVKLPEELKESFAKMQKDVESQAEIAGKSADDYVKENSALRETNIKLVSRSKAAESDLRTYKQKLADAKKDLHTAKKDLDRKQRESKADMKGQSGELSALRHQLAQLKQQLATADSRRKRYLETERDYKRVIHDAKRENDSLASFLQRKDSLLSAAKDQQRKLESTVHQQEGEIKKHALRLDEMERKARAWQAEARTHEVRAIEAGSEIRTLKEQLATVRQDLVKTQKGNTRPFPVSGTSQAWPASAQPAWSSTQATTPLTRDARTGEIVDRPTQLNNNFVSRTTAAPSTSSTSSQQSASSYTSNRTGTTYSNQGSSGATYSNQTSSGATYSNQTAPASGTSSQQLYNRASVSNTGSYSQTQTQHRVQTPSKATMSYQNATQSMASASKPSDAAAGNYVPIHRPTSTQTTTATAPRTMQSPRGYGTATRAASAYNAYPTSPHTGHAPAYNTTARSPYATGNPMFFAGGRRLN
jgi:hypothetical protein